MKHYDVLVTGGGVAGVCAAIASARQGKHTLLVDKQILLGGLATVGRINWLEPYCDGKGHQVIGGLAKELFDRAIACGYSNIPKGWTQGKGRLASWFSPEAFMLELSAWLCEEHVDLLLDTQVVGIHLENNNIHHVVVANLNGCEEISADGFVDATGTAQLFYLSGLPCVYGENYLTLVSDIVDEESLHVALEKNTPYLVRNRTNYGATLYGQGQPAGVPPSAVHNAWEQTQWILDAQSLMRKESADIDPKQREVISLPAMAQIRMLRRMVGDTTFIGVPGTKADDSIGVIPDFRKKYDLFELPFGSLHTSDCKNLYAAGRCISATGEGWHISRVIGPCCLTGEAAGLAAALKGDIHAVQDALVQSGIRIKLDDLI